MRPLLVAMLAALAAGCSLTPTVTRERTFMTPQAISESGLICRATTPIDSRIAKSTCASEAAWAAYDEKHKLATESLFSDFRKLSNVGSRY